MRRLIELVGGMRYDLCVLTGDYRGKTSGPFAATFEGVARVRVHLKDPVYGVLGDHDTIQMVPGLEAMGIRMLLNECAVIVRGAQQIYLAGSMMRTALGSTVSERLRCRYRMASSPSYCRTHRKSIARRLIPILICC